MVIEDEPDILELVVDCLSGPSFELIPLNSTENFLAKVAISKPDLIVTDKRMPGVGGQEVIEQIRGSDQFSNTPILVLSGHDSECAIVHMLEIGADDYIVKPFSPLELKARISALLRRIKPHAGGGHKTIQIDLAGHRISHQGREIAFTLAEFRILKTLLEKANKIVTRQDLVDYGLGTKFVSSRTVDVHIAAVRKKLGDIGKNIRTVRGVGYKFVS